MNHTIDRTLAQTPRSSPASFLALALALSACLLTLACTGSTADRPNVLLITVDTLRPDYLSFTGYDRETSPNLDALINKGTWFSRAVAPVARTTPALGSLLTGLHPHHHGIRRIFDNLSTEATTLAQVAKQNDYQTAAIVSNHVIKKARGLNAGFDIYDNSGDVRNAKMTTSAALLRMRELKRDQAMFVWVHYIDPHVPYRPPAQYVEAFDPGYDGPYAKHFGGRPGSVGNKAYPHDLPKAEAVFHNNLPDRVNEHIRRAYAADIRQTDDAIGTLLSGISADHGDNWVVVFTADHGESLGEHGYFYDHGDYVYDPGIHVPLAFIDLREEGIKSRKVDNWVSLIDVAPTLADWLGWSWPTRLDGRSLLPALRGQAIETRPVFAESGKNFLEGHVPRRVTLDVKGRFRAVMLGDKKLIFTPGSPTPWELYDLVNDPKETVNLWASEGRSKEAKVLVSALQIWMADDKMAEPPANPAACDIEELKALGYIVDDIP
jgi:arylsulfatase A-like enzyme